MNNHITVIEIIGGLLIALFVCSPFIILGYHFYRIAKLEQENKLQKFNLILYEIGIHNTDFHAKALEKRDYDDNFYTCNGKFFKTLDEVGVYINGKFEDSFGFIKFK